jgi:hypothetical protein
LNEVTARHDDFPLVGPSAAVFAAVARQGTSGLGTYKQLWNTACREPGTVRPDDGRDVAWLTVDGKLAWPGERRPSRLTGFAIGAADILRVLRR